MESQLGFHDAVASSPHFTVDETGWEGGVTCLRTRVGREEPGAIAPFEFTFDLRLDPGCLTPT